MTVVVELPEVLEEYVAAFVPEAEYMTWDEALKLADKRSSETALDMESAYEAINA